MVLIVWHNRLEGNFTEVEKSPVSLECIMISHAFAKAVFKYNSTTLLSTENMQIIDPYLVKMHITTTCLFPVDGDWQLHEPVP